MSVVDASVLVDALVVAGPPGDAARTALRERTVLPVPAIFGAEVASALRAMVRHGAVDLRRAGAALAQLRTIRTIQYAFEPFADRVWRLRDNLTVYDAWYVALAERLGLPLVTADERLLASPGPECRVMHVTAAG
ncbi:MAG: type II toxin-antitoxin system VapC family toxin [Actinomycetota bacterium]|nr:type II toxin-antitoxin system VapC family toxin [Actinomycetota bacterium]